MAVVYTETWDVALGGSDSFNATRVTTPVFAGAGALRINSTGAVGYWEDVTPGADPSIIVAHFYLRFASLPTGRARIIHVEGGTNSFELIYDSASGTLRCGFDGANAASGIAVTTGIWYEIDWLARVSTSDLVVAARVDRRSIESYSATGITAPQTFAAYKLGWNDVSLTADVYLDELTVSHTLSDYALSGGPTYIQAGTPVAITGASGSVDITGCTAGNLIVLQVFNDGDDTCSFSSITNIEDLAGTALSLSADVHGGDYQVGNPLIGHQQIRFGRVSADGTCSLTLTAGAGGSDVLARLYEFANEAAGSTTAAIIENADDASNEVSQIGNTSATMFPPDIITSGSDRLAISINCTATNQTLDAFTGGSGSWLEPVVEFASGTIGVIGIQTAPMASQGTISGATDSITSAGWNTLGFAIKPFVLAAAIPKLNIAPHSNLRW